MSSNKLMSTENSHEEEENKIKSLRQAIQEGIDSGLAKNFNSQKHLKLLKVNKRKDCQ